MVRLFVLLAAVQLVLLVLALISCLSAERVRALPRAVWVLVILLLPVLGPVAYFLAGRPVPETPGGAPAGSPGPRPRPRPTSPDDDPDFLRSLNAEQARQDRELLAQWERDLQARESGAPPESGPQVSGPQVPGPQSPGPQTPGPQSPGSRKSGRDTPGPRESGPRNSRGPRENGPDNDDDDLRRNEERPPDAEDLPA